jgi:uncharacterized repeat protein (TIGR01451 family)
MTAFPRCPRLTLLRLLGCLAATLMAFNARLPAQSEGGVCGPVPLPPPPSMEPPWAEGMQPPSQPFVPQARPSADPPTPVVSICVRVPASVAAGQDIEYHLCVENHSPAAAHHVLVRNPLPANARFVRASPEPAVRDPELVWRLGTLDPGAKHDIVLVLAPTGSDDVKNCARVQLEHGQCVSTKIEKPSLRVEKNGPTQANLHDTLTYQIVLTNTGSIDITNLQLADLLAPGLEHAGKKDRLNWIIGALPAGQSKTVEYQVTATKPGRLCNKAVAAAAGGVHQEMETCVTVTEAKLAVSMTGPKTRYLNMPATYRVTVANTGTAPLDQITLYDPLPARTTFVRASAGGQLTGGQVQWALSALAPGESDTVELVLQAQEAGRICNQAIASTARGLSGEAEVCTDFAGLSALSLEVSDTEDPVPVGGLTTYNITVHNQGTTPATNVRVVATVPEQMAVAGADGPADHAKEGPKIIYQPLTVAAGGEARYRIEVKAQRPGDVRFKVELTADALTGGPVVQEESTTIYADIPTSRRKPRRDQQAARSSHSS